MLGSAAARTRRRTREKSEGERLATSRPAIFDAGECPGPSNRARTHTHASRRGNDNKKNNLQVAVASKWERRRVNPDTSAALSRRFCYFSLWTVFASMHFLFFFAKALLYGMPVSTVCLCSSFLFLCFSSRSLSQRRACI